jgi:hypothetical protein
MILFDLICGDDHQFEGWFRDGASYETQAAAAEIACPTCGDRRIRKAPMAPNVIRGATPPAIIREAVETLRHHVEANCDYVGERFVEEARQMHYGEAEQRPVYGEASIADAKELVEEGIEIMPLPWRTRQDG